MELAEPLSDTSFGGFVAAAKAAGDLVVQPRMGFAPVDQMRAGLVAVKNARACVTGTVTLDSYTRVGLHRSARRALDNSDELNGYPLVAHGPVVTRTMLDGVMDETFPVQIRHGAALPGEIFLTLVAAGVDATEGGPVSYCLPYSRTPLHVAVDAWARACEVLTTRTLRGHRPHLESFGGCMLGQLCPPSLLVALSLLEGLFFRQHGLHDISLSYAQQTNTAQDTEAIHALRVLAEELLPDVSWHVVLYTYMGVFPGTELGALALLKESARLAVRSGAERLIVKTPAEAHRIPTVAENVRALEIAAATAQAEREATSAGFGQQPTAIRDSAVYQEARTLVEACLELSADVGTALRTAFTRGYLDVPYCLHPDNANRTRSVVDPRGRLEWLQTGSMPISPSSGTGSTSQLQAAEFLDMLTFVSRGFDARALNPRPDDRQDEPRRSLTP
jgi:methylaspartate mutase epsilon subunit